MTYRVLPADGSWGPADDGMYAVALQGSQVLDTAGNFATAMSVGTFTVAIGAPSLESVTVNDVSQRSMVKSSRGFDRPSPSRPGR